MKKSIVEKIIVSLIAVLLVIGVACTTYATENISMNELAEMLQNQSGNILNENAEQIPEGNNAVLNTNANKNANTNENLPETTPHAGMGSYTGLIFVAIFAVSSIYAYKKVRDYNA